MDIAHKAIFNSLRMGYLQDPTLPYEQWKVEDLRIKDAQSLFASLQEHHIFFDKTSFITYAEQFDSPEEFMDWLLEEEQLHADDFDIIYLIIFELWRRFMPEKMSISIFADELDWQIFHFDHTEPQAASALEDSLENLHNILEENVDHGMEPHEAFSAISEFFANNLEGFLYDFILLHIDEKDYTYAQELIEQFSPFIIDVMWFQFPQARLIAQQDTEQANALIYRVFEKNKQAKELALNFDILDAMVQLGDHSLFLEIADHTLSLIEEEDDFKELLATSSDYFRCLDRDDVQSQIDSLLQKRLTKEGPIQQEDPDRSTFLHIITLSSEK